MSSTGLDVEEAAVQSGELSEDRPGSEHLSACPILPGLLPEVLDRLPIVTYVAERSKPHLFFVSAGIEALLGYRPDEWLADRELRVDRTHPQDRYRVMQERAQARTDGVPFSSEYRLLSRAGHTVWVRDDAVLVGGDGADASPAYWWGVMTDQTDARHAEDELRVRAAQHAAVATLSQRALVIHDRAQLLREAADLVVDTLGMDCALVVERDRTQRSMTVTTAVPADPSLEGLQAQPDSIAHQALDRSGPVVVTDLRYADAPCPSFRADAVSTAAVSIPFPGQEPAVLVVESSRPRVFTRDDLGMFQSVANVLANALSRMSSETQLGQALKLNALGRLSAGIAHDFNNILGAILGFGALLEPAVEEDPLAATHLAELMEAGERAAALVDQLLTFSREKVTQAQAVDLGGVVTDMRGMLSQLLGSGVMLRHEELTERPMVRVDRHQLEQVLMNLVVNARDAMPDGGTIVVRTGVGPHDGESPKAGELSPLDHAVLEVEDTGIGMDALTRAQIFEPFFTTKASGEGTGLGLSTVFGIVQRYDGTIEVDSDVGSGTRVRVYLPIDDSARPLVPSPERASPSHVGSFSGDGRTMRVAVVDDQAAIRTVMGEMLAQHGYEIVSAAGGRECLDALEAGADIDLLLTDVSMPGMTGPELAQQLRELRPSLPVVYMSGYADAVPASDLGQKRRERVLQKPFGMRQLLDVVAEELAASGH